MSNSDIDSLLENWYNTKSQITSLEKKLEKYKEFAEQILDKMGEDKISSKDYTLKRIGINKTSISKADLPPDIFEQYSKELFYNSYYLTKKGEKVKRSRSKKAKKI
jgi:hypothetical protein